MWGGLRLFVGHQQWAATPAEEVIRNSNKQSDFYLNNTFTTNWMSTNTHKCHLFLCSLFCTTKWETSSNYSKQFQHCDAFEEKEVGQKCDLCQLCICICVFVYLCICVCVFVYLHLGICICVFVFEEKEVGQKCDLCHL